MVGTMGGERRKVHNWMDRCFFSLPDGLAVKRCGKEEVGSCLCSGLGNNVPRQVCECLTGIKRE